MSKLQVFDARGAAVGEVNVADDLLELHRGSQAVHEAVVACMAGRRAGTASTLRKGEVAGSNRKPWRQKGTGRARAGLRQSPVWRGGGVAFGPHPRSYEKGLNRKVARLAFRRAFSEKVAAGEVRVIEELSVAEPKTRCFAAIMKAMGLRRSALFVVDEVDRAVSLAARNVHDAELVRAQDLGVFQLLRHPNVVITRRGMETVVRRLSDGRQGGQG